MTSQIEPVGPTASVVIATSRRPHHVRLCLEHLAAQTVAPLRTVVVDESPDDATRTVVAEFTGVEYRRAVPAAAPRASGISDLTEDVVAFLGDDARAEPDWLQRLLLPYSDPAVAGVCGRTLTGRPGEEHEGIGEIGLLLPDGRLTGNFAANPEGDVDIDHMPVDNMSVRLSALRAVGGIPGDRRGGCRHQGPDIGLRLRHAGRRVVYTPRAVVQRAPGQPPAGPRSATRARYCRARGHVVLLVSTLGWTDPHVRHYVRTAARQTAHEILGGARGRRGPKGKLTGAVRGIRDAVVDAVGFISGIFAALSVRRASRAGLEDAS